MVASAEATHVDPPHTHTHTPIVPQLLLDLMSPAALMRACAAGGAGCSPQVSGNLQRTARQSVQVSTDIARAITAGLRGVSGASHGSDSGSGSPRSPGGPTAGAFRPCTAAPPPPSHHAHTPGVSCAPACSAVAGALKRPGLMPAELMGGAAGAWSVGDDPEACSGLAQDDLHAVVLRVRSEHCAATDGRQHQPHRMRVHPPRLALQQRHCLHHPPSHRCPRARRF